MMRWLFVLLLAMVAPAWAIDCTNPNNDGLACLMSDNATQGGCTGGACIRTYTIPGNAARTGTGTISSSSGTVTGSGTAFTTELHVGDMLTVAGQRVVVARIDSNTSLLVSTPFVPSLTAGTAFAYTNPIMRWVDENGQTVTVIDSRGLVSFGLAYADGPLRVIGPVETASGVAGTTISLFAGTGGPAGNGINGGTGGGITLQGAPGGPSTSATLSSGDGGVAIVRGGAAPANTGGGPNGRGGNSQIDGGPGAVTGLAGNVLLCSVQGTTTKIGMGLTTTDIDCATGNITKIKNVPVAGMWNVNAFQQANAGGM